MQASAVLVVDDRCLSATASNAELAYKGRSANKTRSVACAEIFGESLLSRTVRRLRNAGIGTISIVGASIYPLGKLNAGIRYVTAPRSRQCWPAAQQEVMRLYAEGVQTVFMIGVHAYIEWDVEEVLRFHLAHGLPLTQLHDAQGPLEVWAVESEWFSSAAFGCTLPFRYGEFPGLPISCPITGYVNRLTKGEDLRRFVEDGFLSRCETRPQCDEVKPGVWVEDGARVHRSARLVAPVYLGASTKIGASAVITRFSNVERHSTVGTGTVVDGASVLSFTELGAGLELSGTILEGNTLVDVRRNVALCIQDPNLIRDTGVRHQPVIPSRRQIERSMQAFQFADSSFFFRAAGRLSEVFFR